MESPEDRSKTFGEANFNTITFEEDVINLPDVYQYSKVSSGNKAWEYMAIAERSIDLILLLAPAITGRSNQVGFKPSKDSLGGM